MKILLVKRDKIGDLMLATPMLGVLREALPSARIDVLASDYNAWVLGGNPHVDAVHVYRRTRLNGEVSIGGALQQAALWFSLRRERYDVAIAAGGEDSPRATRRAVFLRAGRTIAYAEPTRGLTDALVAPDAGHERERLLGLLSPLGIAIPQDPPLPRYEPPASTLAESRTWLAERGLEPGRYVVLGLGARRAKKQPTCEQVLRWATYLRASHGLDLVFMWTPGSSDNRQYPGDDDLARNVLAGNPPGIHPFRGPILPAVGLIWHARTSVFPDSGLMHLAAASPGGVLGLFASAEQVPPAARWAPLGGNADYLEASGTVSQLDDARVQERLTALIRRAGGD